MTLPIVKQLGAPNYGTLRDAEGIVFHTPENASPSLEDAIATARWQASAGNSSGGSYHGILAWDKARGPMSDPDSWVLVKTVPFTDIAGSISTRRDAVWQPGRFPWIKELLSDAAYNDPNAYLHALCLGGKASWWSSKLSTPEGRSSVRGALVALARWVRKLERSFEYDAVLTLHRHWQTNRTDPDGLDFKDLILDEYARLGESSTPDDDLRARVTELEARVASVSEERDEVVARLDEINELATRVVRLAKRIKEA